MSRRPRASIVMAAHNEGGLLAKTVELVHATTRGVDFEVVVVDDASRDDCIERLLERFPRTRVIRHRQRRGCSAAKDRAARAARGKVLVFLDGHSKPEPGAIARLVRDVEELDGEAVISPLIPVLDVETWTNSKRHIGCGVLLDLRTFGWKWLRHDRMWARPPFYESPSLCGCCMAVSRALYLKLRGFDPHMLEWGIEDIDLGLKCWLLGHPILFDPRARIGHRFRKVVRTYTVQDESVLANQIRMARKCLAEPLWEEWVAAARARERRGQWRKAWKLFLQGRESAERERRYLLRHRRRDELEYARRFGLAWPRGPAPRRPRRLLRQTFLRLSRM